MFLYYFRYVLVHLYCDRGQVGVACDEDRIDAPILDVPLGGVEAGLQRPGRDRLWIQVDQQDN